MKKNDIKIGIVIGYTHEGLGVVKIDDFPFFIENVIKDEEVEFKIIKLNKHYGYGKLVNIIKVSSERVFDLEKTSGANLIHMSYEEQLRFKKEKVETVLIKALGFDNGIKVADTIGMENPFNYRNKSIIPVGIDNGTVKMGYYRPRSHNIVDVEHCHIQYEEHNVLLNKIREIISKLNISIYDEEKHSGALRNVMFRTNSDKTQIMIGFISTKKFTGLDKLVDEVKALDKNIVSIMLNINDKKTNVILGDKTICLWGKEYITDELDGIKFNISMNSFYQVNASQTKVLYNTAIDLANLSETDTVIDAYCGIGTISLFMAQKVKKVYGIEVVEQAILDAKNNAKLNDIDNVEFLCGKSEDVILDLIKKDIKIDAVIVDPPRKGCDESFLVNLAKMNIKNIVYVSCNPATLARDIKIMKELGYSVGSEVVPVDMFPFTHHVECVVLMTKK